VRNISFALTTAQFLDGTKTVTRRLGWKDAKAGDVLMAVEKSQGLKKGEKVKKLGTIRLMSVRREPLAAIDRADVAREGFPRWSPENFIYFFCKSHRGCFSDTIVTRLEFERIPHPQRQAP